MPTMTDRLTDRAAQVLPSGLTGLAGLGGSAPGTVPA
jgi:hypothetical protein